MKTETKQKIVDFISENGPTRPVEIAKKLEISSQMVHRHLRSLAGLGSIRKLGTPPKVYYQVAILKPRLPWPNLPNEVTDYVNENYYTVTPEGRKLSGQDGFLWWAQKTKQEDIECLAKEYVGIHGKFTQNYKNSIGLIDASFKIVETFPISYLDVLLYQEFYSLPKFGKTKSGQLVYLGKSGQDIKAIHELAHSASIAIKKIVEFYEIDALVYAPHSIPRKIPFLPELTKEMDLDIPKISLFKIFAENIPIAQKSLNKLADRISNANSTIFLETKNFKHKRILVIDDAVGSGATLNAIGMKLKKNNTVKFVCGYALTGSLKGFDVVKEI